jgi:hypothetical protein
MSAVEIIALVAIVFGSLAFLRRKPTHRQPSNVVRFVPRSTPPRAELTVAGEVIEFPTQHTQKGTHQ